jgi:hypothetical protein
MFWRGLASRPGLCEVVVGLVTHAASTGSMSIRQRSTGNSQRTADVGASMISPAEEISWLAAASIAKQTSGSGKARNLIPIEGQNLRVG